jgi:hypothetical protein
MRFYLLTIPFLIMACGDSESEYTAENISEQDEVILEEDTESALYDLSSQSEIVKDFFKLTSAQIGDGYCYSEDDVKELILGDAEDDPDRYLNGFENWNASDNYLLFENTECYSTFEFKTFYRGERRQALLVMTDKGNQDVKFFEYADEQEQWVEKKYLPKPKSTDFFADLSPFERDLVEKYGVYFMMVSEKDLNFSYYFSTWQMGMNAGETEMDNFNREPRYEFVLKWDNEGYWLSKKWINEADQPNRYLMVYSDDGNYDQEFMDFAKELSSGEWLKGYNFEYIFVDFSETDYKAFFSQDTFDLSHNQQFEARNGYWAYQEGLEPLDLEAHPPEYIYNVIQRYFDRADEQ